MIPREMNTFIDRAWVLTLGAIVIAVLAMLMLSSCDNRKRENPTEPTVEDEVEVDRLTADFRCFSSQTNSVVLTCVDRTTGGVRPLKYDWLADFQEPVFGTSQNSVAFNYQDYCTSVGFRRTSVVVSMHIVDAAKEQDTAEESSQVCGVL